MEKITPAQRRMLKRLEAGSERAPFGMGRGTGRAASAWYRTAEALRWLGKITLTREGDGWRAEARQ